MSSKVVEKQKRVKDKSISNIVVDEIRLLLKYKSTWASITESECDSLLYLSL